MVAHTKRYTIKQWIFVVGLFFKQRFAVTVYNFRTDHAQNRDLTLTVKIFLYGKMYTDF